MTSSSINRSARSSLGTSPSGQGTVENCSQAGALTSTRFWEIDVVRGIAIVMMVLYHLIFNLDYFGGYAVDSSGGFWRPFATVTASLFLLIVGVSLMVSHDRAQGRSRGST
jgi:uncharacterized membrane protein